MSEKTSLNCEAGCWCTENMTDMCKVALAMKFLMASYCDMLRSGKYLDEICVNEDCMKDGDICS
jgi:hypothetical protein